jgi:hypothetical protein
LCAGRKALTASRAVLNLHIRSPSSAFDEECSSTCNLQSEFASRGDLFDLTQALRFVAT